MVEIWYCSDHHFDHAKIIEYSNRPFANVEEMNEELIKRHNEVVKPHHHCWFGGDLTMHRKIHTIKYRILDRLNGHKRLLLGNHDLDTIAHYSEWFEKIKASHVHDNILFTHIPVHPEALGRFRGNAHGHSHCNNYAPAIRYKWINGVQDKTRPYSTPYINLSVEQTDFRPISLEELNQRIKEQS